MAAKMMLVCCMAVLFIETQSVLGFFQRPGSMPNCKTDASCGAGSLTVTVEAIDYCCAAGAKLSLGVESLNNVITASCKCLIPFDFRSLIPKSFKMPQMCQRYQPGETTPCGANAKTGTVNNKDVCCSADFTLHIIKKTRRSGATKEYCSCKAIPPPPPAAVPPPVAAPVAAPPPPPAPAPPPAAAPPPPPVAAPPPAPVA